MRYHRNVPGYYVENFGCRATQADGAALESLLRSVAGTAAVLVTGSLFLVGAIYPYFLGRHGRRSLFSGEPATLHP